MSPVCAVISSAIVAMALMAGCASPGVGWHATSVAVLPATATAEPAGYAPSSDALRSVLAPTGHLRVAMYRGSPSSYVQAASNDAGGEPGGAPSAEPRGVAFDLGRAFAAHLGVPFEPLVFPKNDDAITAVKEGRADFAFTNASPERARLLDFSPTVLDVEKSVLVGPASAYTTLDSLKGKPVRIGVSVGSTSALELQSMFPRAIAQTVPTLQDAIEMLRLGQLDGFATNDAILYEMSDHLAGSTVLPGRTGMEHFGVGIPHGRQAGSAFVSAFVAAAKADGTVDRAVRRAGLRGAVGAGQDVAQR